MDNERSLAKEITEGFEALKSMRNNEPVAWIDEETGCFVYSQYDYEDLDEHGKDGLIPLYTHPVKELTDELNQLLYSVNGDAYLGKDKEEALVKIVRKQYTKPVKELTDEEIIELTPFKNHPYDEFVEYEKEDLIEFAKAILRKAQEK